MILNAKSILDENPKPSRDEILKGLEGTFVDVQVITKFLKLSWQPQQERIDMEELSFVGKSIPRKDGLEKVTGRALYSVDMVLPGCCGAKF